MGASRVHQSFEFLSLIAQDIEIKMPFSSGLNGPHTHDSGSSMWTWL
jgi:hypothetical protein